MKNSRSWIYLFFVILVGYIGVQVYNIKFADVITQRAEHAVENQAISMEGVMVRNENVIWNETTGVISHLVYDGSHVQKNAVVASIYTSEQDVETQMEVRELEEKITQLEQAQSADGVTIRDPVKIDSEVTGLLSDLIYDVNIKNTAAVKEAKNNIELLLNVKSIVTQQKLNFDDEIGRLQSEKAILEKAISQKVTDVSTSVSGYFCTSIDGFEEQFQPDNLEGFNVADVELMMSMPAQNIERGQSNIVGKVVTDFCWYFVGIVNADRVSDIGIDKAVKVTFPFSESGAVDGTIDHISNPSDGRCVVVVKGTNMDAEMLHARKSKSEIILNSYTGIKITKEARRVVDGQVGVYVLEGPTCHFKPINVLYEGEDCVIAEELDPTVPGNEDCLQTTDEIIISGKDLADGKVVRT